MIGEFEEQQEGWNRINEESNFKAHFIIEVVSTTSLDITTG